MRSACIIPCLVRVSFPGGLQRRQLGIHIDQNIRDGVLFSDIGTGIIQLCDIRFAYAGHLCSDGVKEKLLLNGIRLEAVSSVPVSQFTRLDLAIMV